MSPTVAQHQFLSLSRSLSRRVKLVVLHSNKLHCSDGVDCIFGIVVLSLSLCLGLCLCAALLLSMLISVGQTHCVGAQWANIYAVVLLLFSFLFFLSSCRTFVVVVVGLFYGFLFRCTCAKFKAALSSPYQRRRRRSLNS